MKKNMNVLIVDDDAYDREVFIRAVKQVDETIECVELTNGEQALKELRDTSRPLPDCIFLDLRMPRISGKKCLEEIMNDGKLKHIPVYIYTTSREVEESRELMKMGAFHFISKPKNEDEVYYLVAFALEEQLNLLGDNS
jgi:DNA-binding NtrC family response regulator